MVLLLVVAVKMILKGIKIWKEETKMITTNSNGLNSGNEWGSGVIEKNTSENPFLSTSFSSKLFKILPAYITATRSAKPKTSSNSAETKSTAEPASRAATI